jgi:hypothetical protein
MLILNVPSEPDAARGPEHGGGREANLFPEDLRQQVLLKW